MPIEITPQSNELEFAQNGTQAFIKTFNSVPFETQITLAYSTSGEEIQAILLGLKPAAYLGAKGKKIANRARFEGIETAEAICAGQFKGDKPFVGEDAIFYSPILVQKVITDNPDYFPPGTTINQAVNMINTFAQADDPDAIVRTGLLLGFPKSDVIDYITYHKYEGKYGNVKEDIPERIKRQIETRENLSRKVIPGIRFTSFNSQEYIALLNKYEFLYKQSGLQDFIEKLSVRHKLSGLIRRLNLN